MVKRTIKTIERYLPVYNHLQVGKVPLSSLGKISYKQFKSKTGLKSESQFRLAKAIARNPDLQKDINRYLKGKAIPKTLIKPISIKQYIPKTVRLPTITRPFTIFSKKVKKFRIVKGKRFEITTSRVNFRRDSERMLKDILRKAERETQNYTAKQIKVNITSNIAPDKNQPTEKEVSTRSFQSKARVDKNDLKHDFDKLMTQIDDYVSNYAPEGSITVSISIINYTI